MTRRLGLASIALACAAVVAFAGDDDPIKMKSSLDDRVNKVAREIADKRVALARKLDKAKLARDAWEELMAAIRIDPKHSQAREKLGFKKKGADWEGGETPPSPTLTPLDKSSPELAKERAAIRKEASQRLAQLARRAKAGGLDHEARRVAALANDEEPSEPAHAALGHEKGEAAGDWTSDRERKVRAAFAKYLAKASTGEERPKDEPLEQALGLTGLKVRETPHALVISSGAANAKLEEIAKVVETVYASVHYFLLDMPEGFEVEGEPARQATGDSLPPWTKPRFLVLSGKSEHTQFCEKLIKDPAQKAVALTCAGAFAGTPGPTYEAVFPPNMLSEWAAMGMAEYLVLRRVLKEPRNSPRYMLEAVKRWFQGHASRRADIYTVAAGSTSSKRELEGGAFFGLRPLSRAALVDGTADELRVALAKGPNDLVRLDVAVGCSFVDWALAKERAGLVKFFRDWDPKSPDGPAGALEKAFGRGVSALEGDWKGWAREEY